MGVKITTDYDLFFPNQIEYDKAKTFFKDKNAEIKWESDNGMKVKYNDKTFDLAKKQLLINKITYPASTMSRAFRYYKKGFSMCQGEMKKLVESIQDMPKQENKNDESNDNTPPSGDDETTTFF